MIVTTLVTGKDGIRDIKTLLFTLNQYSTATEIYIYTDSATKPLLQTIPSQIPIHILPCLDAYTGFTRADMEARPGSIYSSLWSDFMAEKANVMEYALQRHPEGVWFLDADICLFSALPVLPEGVQLALSPHMIRPGDEAKFGRYNGGMMWIKEPRLLSVWREATHTSRFFEQAALEALVPEVSSDAFFSLPIQHNFGWWRLLQSADAPPVIQKRLGYKRTPANVGLTYNGEILCSIHTHLHEKSLFNEWIRGALEVVGRSHPPAKQLLTFWKKLKNE